MSLVPLSGTDGSSPGVCAGSSGRACRLADDPDRVSGRLTAPTQLGVATNLERGRCKISVSLSIPIADAASAQRHAASSTLCARIGSSPALA